MVVEQPGPDPAGAAEPVAVIGIGCRFPGNVTSPEEFWQLLSDARVTTDEIPERRWDWYRDLGPGYAAALRRAITRGSYLDDIEGFDAEFFGLSGREAELMDPQQRILLEVAWEALEHAGVPPHGLRGSDTGVFMGVCTDDYGRRLMEDLPNIEAWTGIGAATCAIANRISYALDLRGPSFAVDTACSASLVAVHTACQSLLLGETDLALAGGVNLVVSPSETLSLDEAGALAPDGRSKSFDATADGYGRGEGCGVLVLKLLSQAMRDGDRVLAVIRGTAVNQDGHTNGIMAPSREAQQYVMTRACARAGIDPGSVGYVEAHGTGTRLGDPLEAAALSAVYGAGRDGKPCLIGSVKTNIGHLEGAAGVAGMIKAILALERATIPASPLVTELNPDIPWDTCGLRVVTRTAAWPAGRGPRRAGVSCFGYGGTVAHVVLEQAPEPGPAPTGTAAAGVRLYPVAANTAAGLRRQAGRLADWLSGAGAEVPLDSIGHTLARRRSPLHRRAAVVAADHAELVDRLRRLAADEPADGLVTGTPLPTPGPGLVWVFSGHGSQWVGMGRDLLATEPAFAAVIDELEPVFQAEIGFSPRQVLVDGDFETVDRIQTMIFAMQVGLAAVWRSYGVRPHAVIGHSVGEIAAAVTSGALSLADGGRLICRRSILLRRVAGQGAMAMVGLPFAEVAARLAGDGDPVAAISASPASTVVAGTPEGVQRLIDSWSAEDIMIRRVASDVAFHSPQMQPLTAELTAAAADLTVRPPTLRMYSTSQPDPRAVPVTDGAYWAGNLREPVRLTDAVAAAVADGYRAFLEVSAHPVVTHSIGETLAEAGLEDVYVGTSLRRDRPEQRTLLQNAGDAHCHGVPVDWSRLQPTGDLVDLPTVAWQHRPYWHERPGGGAGEGQQHDPQSHALLGARTALADRALGLWRTWLDDSCRPYPGSHALNGVEIVPAAVLVNTFFEAVSGDGPPPVLTDLSMSQPLMTAERREIQVIVDDTAARLASRAVADGKGQDTPWLTHATATIAPHRPDLPEYLPDGDPNLRRVEPGLVRDRLAQVGVPETGFEWSVETLTRGPGVLRGRVRYPRPPAGTATTWAPVLDAVMSLAPVTYPGDPVLRMVVHAQEIVVTGAPPEVSVIDIVVRPEQPDTVDALVTNAHGRVVARVAGLRYAVIGEQAATARAYEPDWRPLGLPETPVDRPVLVVGDPAGRAGALCAALTAAGADCRTAVTADGVGAGTDVLVVPPEAPPGPDPVHAVIGSAAPLLAAAGEVPDDARLWCVTSGLREGGDPVQSSLAALVRGLGTHRSGLSTVVDVPGGNPREYAGLLLRALAIPAGEDVIALHNGAAVAARLTRRWDSAPPASTCGGEATYLVTNALGDLGRAAATWLADQGARRLVLADTVALPPRRLWDDLPDGETRRSVEAVRALERRGVTVRSMAMDLADTAEAGVLRDPDALALPAIRGVVHVVPAAGAGPLPDAESLAAALRPVAAVTATLDALFPATEVDFTIVLSASDPLLGEPGHAIDGVVAGYLDGWALRRSAGGGRTVSLGWPGGASPGGAAWSEAVAGNGSVAVLALPASDARPLVSEVTGGPEDDSDGPDTADLADLSAEALRGRLMDEISEQIAVEMRLPAADLDLRRSLIEQGLDSVMTVMIRRRLEKRFGQALPATLLWQKPTVTAIAGHLAALLRAPEAAIEEPAVAVPAAVC